MQCLRLVVFVLPTVLAGACGGAVETTEREPAPEEAEQNIAAEVRSETAPESMEPSEPTVSGGAAVEEYFRAFASSHPADMRNRRS